MYHSDLWKGYRSIGFLKGEATQSSAVNLSMTQQVYFHKRVIVFSVERSCQVYCPKTVEFSAQFTSGRDLREPSNSGLLWFSPRCKSELSLKNVQSQMYYGTLAEKGIRRLFNSYLNMVRFEEHSLNNQHINPFPISLLAKTFYATSIEHTLCCWWWGRGWYRIEDHKICAYNDTEVTMTVCYNDVENVDGVSVVFFSVWPLLPFFGPNPRFLFGKSFPSIVSFRFSASSRHLSHCCFFQYFLFFPTAPNLDTAPKDNGHTLLYLTNTAPEDNGYTVLSLINTAPEDNGYTMHSIQYFPLVTPVMARQNGTLRHLCYQYYIAPITISVHCKEVEPAPSTDRHGTANGIWHIFIIVLPRYEQQLSTIHCKEVETAPA